MVSDVMND